MIRTRFGVTKNGHLATGQELIIDNPACPTEILFRSNGKNIALYRRQRLILDRYHWNSSDTILYYLEQFTGLNRAGLIQGVVKGDVAVTYLSGYEIKEGSE